MFTPKSKRHYGQLLCTASNLVGKQERPCVINVVPSELPDPVFGCFFDNLTNSSFSVHCQTSQASTGRQSYLLEISQNGEERAAVATAHRDHDEPTRAFNEQNSERQHQQQQQQQEMRRLFSESPSFEVTDLQPGTSYNIMIYVQNQKGRSPPALHQTSTLPANEVSGSPGAGKIHLNGKRISPNPSLSERIMSYLRVNDLLNNERSKPILGILLVILLCTITTVVIVFSVTRLCQQNPTSNETNRNRRRKRDSVAPEQRSHSSRSLQLLASESTSRVKETGGSGSDTSRELHTDSTAISFGCVKTEPSSSKQAQLRPKDEIMVTPEIQDGNPKRDRVVRGLTLAREQKRCNHHRQFANHSLERRSNLGSLMELDHSNTPRASVQSESDRTSSNEIPPDHSEFHDQIIIGCHENINEPLYVIGSGGKQTESLGSHEVRFINTPSFWPYVSTLETKGASKGNGGVRVGNLSNTNSCDRSRITSNTPNPAGCKLIMNQGLADIQLPIGFMPNSISIPASLSECAQLNRAARQQLHQSQEFLPRALCISNSEASYVRLEPEKQLPYQDSVAYDQVEQNLAYSGIRGQQQQQQQMVANSVPFASITPSQYCCDGLVETAPNSSCTQTVDRLSGRFRGTPVASGTMAQAQQHCNEYDDSANHCNSLTGNASGNLFVQEIEHDAREISCDRSR